MKPESNVMEIEGSLPGERIEMGIDSSAMAHIMSVLTNLYSDETLAVIREYSTNARDAHIDAGKADLPIEVTLPSPLAPYLQIKDQGIGLSASDIRDIYSKYGASTKRDSDEVVGMLGLGCKSALAYGDTFTMSAIKDGQKIEVAISVSEEGGGEMTVVDEYATDEPNGVTVIIPVTDYNEFDSTARDFFYFWKKGTVLINGEEPKSIFDDQEVFWIADDLAVIPRQGEDKIVMGNVAYPMEATYDYNKRYSVIAFVNIGEVNFVPSREALLFNTKTKATIEKVNSRIETEASNAITKQVEGADSKPEALAVYNRFYNIFRGKFKIEATYKDKSIPQEMNAPLTGKKYKDYRGEMIDQRQDFMVVKSSANKGYREKGWHRMNAYPSSLWGKTLFIRGYDGADFSPYKRKKMDQWVEELNAAGTPVPEYDTVVFTSKVPEHHWIEKGRIFNWNDIKDQKIVRENVKKQDGRLSGSYEGFVDGAWKHEIEAKDIDTTNPVIYAEKNHGYNNSAFEIVKRETNGKFTFVQIGSNRVAKFLRDFPTATTIHEYAKKLATAWEKTLTDDDKLHLHIVNTDTSAYGSTGLSNLTKLKDDLEDEDLRDAIHHVQNKRTKLINSYNRFNGFVDLNDVKWDNPLEKYTLLQSFRVYGTMTEMQKQHITLYINAVHAAGQEEA
jgi:hypothetical protein